MVDQTRLELPRAIQAPGGTRSGTPAGAGWRFRHRGRSATAAIFQPTAVLLEYDPENDTQINERYEQYRADQFQLPANEICQLGFGLALKAGLERAHSFDHRFEAGMFGP